MIGHFRKCQSRKITEADECSRTMASESSNQASSSDEDTVLYTPPVQKRRRGVPRRAVARGRVQRRREEEVEVLATLRRKKERLREIIAEMKETESKTILLATVEKDPDILWDILNCGQFDGQPAPQPGSSSQSPSPSPSPSPSSPSWCVCGNCREMPTQEERVCCGKAPQYCVSMLPHFQVVALDENVLRVANLYRQDIFAYLEENDRNKAFRHCGYRQFILWHHGRLGAGNRLVIPSCCVWAIRRKFPDPNGHYVGFVPGRLG